MLIRIVCDANVFASALIKPNGTPGKCLKSVISSSKFQLIITNEILKEIQRILFYPKVRKYIALKDEEIIHWLDAVLIVSYFFEPLFQHKGLITEDPDDDKYLIAAMEGKAQYVISGDHHLLVMNGFRGLNIISPQEFYGLIDQF